MSSFQGMRAFLRVVESGGFTAAGVGAKVSTSQMSRLVTELEEELGVKLLRRTTRRITLTEAGGRYLARARRILAAVEEAETEVKDAHLRASGTLRIHCIASFAVHHLIPLLALYRKRYPEVVINLTLDQRMPRMLEEGHDVALTFSPATQGSGLVVKRIARSPFVLCASPGYVAEHGVPTTPAELANHRCLNLEPPDNGGEWTFQGRKGAQIVAVDPVLSVNVPEAMTGAIAAGMGIGLLFGYSSVKGIRTGELIRVLPNHPMKEMSVFALYPEREYLDAKVSTFLAFLDEHIPAALAGDARVLGSHKPPRAFG